MTEQHHRICRQILEIHVPDAAAAWPLQTAFGRVHSRYLAAVIERCCTEVGDPGRLHRIESLEVDLGRLDPAHLERDLVDRLGPSLRPALTRQIREDDEQIARSGRDPEIEARLELVAYFARHGHLPWWAEPSQPRIVNDAIELLLRRAAPSLVTLMRTLACERDALLRIIVHAADERLSQLFAALVAAARLDLPAGLEMLGALLHARGAVPEATPSRFRVAVWIGVLQAASVGDGARGAIGFWREALGRIAHEAGVTCSALVHRLETIEIESSGEAGALHEIARCLAREMQGAPPSDPTLREAASSFPPADASESAPSSRDCDGPLAPRGETWTGLDVGVERRAGSEASFSERAVTASESTQSSRHDDGAPDEDTTEIDRLVGRLLGRLFGLPSRSELSLSELLTELRAAAHDTPEARQRALPGPLQGLDRLASTIDPSAPEAAARLVRAVLRIIEQRDLPREALQRFLDQAHRAAAVSNPATDAALESALVAEVHRWVREVTSTDGSEEAVAASDLVETSESCAHRSLRKAIATGGSEAPVAASAHVGDPEARADTTLAVRAPEVRDGASAHLPGSGRQGGLPGEGDSVPRGTVGRREDAPPVSVADGRAFPPVFSAPQGRPAAERSLLRLDRADLDEAYVENAGLVVLWPFLRHLFERLELVVDRQFKNAAACERAAGLLQHLASGECEPVEYQLPLAKVLCGIEPADVVDVGLSVTEVEAEECANLLTAAIANAPILGEMSIADFRGSFLIRKGVLATRDGAWLLRVERAAYDVVLDRLPWAMSWVKLPWMETPLAVEW